MIKPSIKTTIWALFCLSIFSSFLLSQTDEEYIGVAQGKDLQAVKNAAFQNLAQQIQVLISSKSSREIREENKILKDSLVSLTLTQSFVNLTDVTEKVVKIDDENFKVTKSVSKANVQKMFAMRRKQILEYLGEVDRLFQEGDTTSSITLRSILDNYYQAYLLNAIYPDTLTYYFTTQATSLAVGIPNKISEIVHAIECIPEKQIDDEYTVWKYRVRYKGKDISSFHYSYFDGMGQTDGMVEHGETMMTLYYSSKEKKERQVQVQIEFPLAEELDNTVSAAQKFVNTSELQKMMTITVPGETTASHPVPEEKLAPPPVPEEKPIQPPGQKLPKELNGLTKIPLDFENTINELKRLVRAGIIVQGRASDFESLKGLYSVVVDKTGLAALLHNVDNKYYDFISGRIVVLKDYAGMRIVWFEFLK